MSFTGILSYTPEPDSDPGRNRLAQWLRLLDVEFYRTHPHAGGVADLIQKTPFELYHHFVTRGWKEGRSFNRVLHAFLDPDFYMRRYPELGLQRSADAVRHWMYEGAYEGRVPNWGTDRVVESDIHLFQFGKVGSKAIEHAIYSAGYDRLVLHLHWPGDLIKTHADCFYSYGEVISLASHRRLRFVTGVRDPIERAISGYFQTHADKIAGYTPERIEDDIVTAVVGEQMKNLLSWFEHGFFSGLDVFAFPFDKERGYTIIDQPPIALFLYRLDRLPELALPLSTFLDLGLSLRRVNCATDKHYSYTYQEMLRSLRFPRAVVQRILESRLVSHFFDRGQIQKMYDRWSA